MADLEDLGTPAVFAELLRVGYDVARLRLAADPTMPREVAAAAAQVGRAVLALQEAVDLAAELEAEGARQPVALVGAGPEAAALVWSHHAELQRAIEHLVGASLGYAPEGGEPAAEYRALIVRSAAALGAIEEQRRAALEGMRPRPEPPEPSPPARPAPATETPERRGRASGPDGGEDGPPAARLDAQDAPDLGDLRRRMAALRAMTTTTEELVLPDDLYAPVSMRSLGGRGL